MPDLSGGIVFQYPPSVPMRRFRVERHTTTEPLVTEAATVEAVNGERVFRTETGRLVHRLPTADVRGPGREVAMIRCCRPPARVLRICASRGAATL